MDFINNYSFYLPNFTKKRYDNRAEIEWESGIAMSMEKVISYVNTNRGDGQKSSLDRLLTLLNRLGNPHQHLNYIHITGTNGKGSTTAMFASVLQEAQLSVGIFTSPHLERVNERIRFNGEMIEDADFIRIVNQIEPVVLEIEAAMGVKYYAFELLTVVAFIYFQEKQPDIVLLEAGIGGRLDSTNVIESALVSIITSIGLDHIATLGETKEAIMNEKAHILKDGGHLIVGPVADSLKEIAQRRADAVNGSVTFINQADIHLTESLPTHQTFTYKEWKTVELAMLGVHQVENASLVLEAIPLLVAQGLSISREAVYKGLEKAYWPGRFECVGTEPLFYIDGAHNEDGVRRLVETLEATFPGEKFYFVVGMMKDKAYEKMLAQVAHLAREFILVSPDAYRGFDADAVAEKLCADGFKATALADVSAVLAYVADEVPKDGVVIQFGSLYLVGDIKKISMDRDI